MAQPNIIAPPFAAKRPERSFEDIFSAHTSWLRAPGKSRTQSCDTSMLGCHVKLFEFGQLQAHGRGRGFDEALEDALEQVGAFVELDAEREAEERDR